MLTESQIQRAKELLEKNGMDFDKFELENEFSAKSILNAMEEYHNTAAIEQGDAKEVSFNESKRISLKRVDQLNIPDHAKEELKSVITQHFLLMSKTIGTWELIYLREKQHQIEPDESPTPDVCKSYCWDEECGEERCLSQCPECSVIKSKSTHPALEGKEKCVVNTDKPLTECMAGRDTECNHPQCPVTDEDVRNGRYCTLPLYDYRQ